jgi:hypothetical protein
LDRERGAVSALGTLSTLVSLSAFHLGELSAGGARRACRVTVEGHIVKNQSDRIEVRRGLGPSSKGRYKYVLLSGLRDLSPLLSMETSGLLGHTTFEQ